MFDEPTRKALIELGRTPDEIAALEERHEQTDKRRQDDEDGSWGIAFKRQDVRAVAERAVRGMAEQLTRADARLADLEAECSALRGELHELNNNTVEDRVHERLRGWKRSVHVAPTACNGTRAYDGNADQDAERFTESIGRAVADYLGRFEL